MFRLLTKPQLFLWGSNKKMGFRRGATSKLPLRSQIPCAIEAQDKFWDGGNNKPAMDINRYKNIIAKRFKNYYCLATYSVVPRYGMVLPVQTNVSSKYESYLLCACGCWSPVAIWSRGCMSMCVLLSSHTNVISFRPPNISLCPVLEYYE